jgi:hypothetical protein
MTKTSQVRALAVVAAAVLALCVLAVVAVKPVEAAYPGKNGKIAFFSNRSGTNIFTINPNSGHRNQDHHLQWSQRPRLLAQRL